MENDDHINISSYTKEVEDTALIVILISSIYIYFGYIYEIDTLIILALLSISILSFSITEEYDIPLSSYIIFLLLITEISYIITIYTDDSYIGLLSLMISMQIIFNGLPNYKKYKFIDTNKFIYFRLLILSMIVFPYIVFFLIIYDDSNNYFLLTINYSFLLLSIMVIDYKSSDPSSIGFNTTLGSFLGVITGLWLHHLGYSLEISSLSYTIIITSLCYSNIK